MSVEIEGRKGKKGISYRLRWINPDTGLYETETLGRVGKTAAQIAAAEKQRAISAGIVKRYQPHRISELRDALDVAQAGRSNDYLDQNRKTLDELISVVKDLYLDRLTQEHALQYRKHVIDKGNSVYTVNRKLREVKACLGAAVHLGWIERNPLRDFRGLFVKEPQLGIRVIEPGEFEAMLLACENQTERVFLALGYYAGLRAGEMRVLRWDMVDTKDWKSLQIRAIVEDGKVVWKPKSGKGRTVPIRPGLLVELRKLWDETPKVVADGKSGPADPHVLLGRLKKPFATKWALGKVFERVAKRAGVTGASPHDLRRSFSTILQRAGVDRSTVKDLGGWSCMSVLERHYTGELDQSAAEKVREADARIAAAAKRASKAG